MGIFLVNFRFWLLEAELRKSISTSFLQGYERYQKGYALSFYILRKVFSQFFSKTILGFSKAMRVFEYHVPCNGKFGVPSISIEVLGPTIV